MIRNGACGEPDGHDTRGRHTVAEDLGAAAGLHEIDP